MPGLVPPFIHQRQGEGAGLPPPSLPDLGGVPHVAYNDRAYRALRPLVLAEAKYQCQIRGPHCTGQASTVDHIVALSAGGSNDLNNLRAACTRCNYGLGSQISAQIRKARTMGMRSRRW